MASIHHKNQAIVDPFFERLTETLKYDSHTNPDLYSEVYSNPSAYSVVDGTLLKGGSPVAINDWCDDCKTLDSLDTASTVAQLKKVLVLMRDKPGFTRG